MARFADDPKFDSKYVQTRREEPTGEITDTPRLSWAEIFAGLDAADVPADFLSPEERNQGLPRERPDLFDDSVEDSPPDPSVK